MAGRKHGKNGLIQMDAAGGASLVSLADLNAYTLDMSTDRVDVTCFQDTNKQRVAGLPDFTGTVAGIWNSASSPTLFAAILAGTPVTLRLIPDNAEPTYYFQGLSNLDGSLNVDAKGAITISGKWDAAGNWDMNP
jgi:predicted secreted protein